MNPIRPTLKRALCPENIAVIGASDRTASRGSFVWRAVARSKLLKNAWAINPKYKYIGERPCFSSINEVPGSIDLAVISLRADRILKALIDAGAETETVSANCLALRAALIVAADAEKPVILNVTIADAEGNESYTRLASSGDRRVHVDFGKQKLPDIFDQVEKLLPSLPGCACNSNQPAVQIHCKSVPCFEQFIAPLDNKTFFKLDLLQIILGIPDFDRTSKIRAVCKRKSAAFQLLLHLLPRVHTGYCFTKSLWSTL